VSGMKPLGAQARKANENVGEWGLTWVPGRAGTERR